MIETVSNTPPFIKVYRPGDLDSFKDKFAKLVGQIDNLSNR